MSSSRLRDEAPTIFDVFCEIVRNDGEAGKARIVWKYPDDFNDSNVLKSVVEFAFPTSTIESEAVQLFTFVLTDSTGRYSFGYCRHTPGKESCFCVLSALPWTDVFYRLLNHVAALAKRSPQQLTSEAESLLVRAYHQEIPGPGELLVLDSGLGSGNKVEFVCPNDNLLPRIPDNRNLTEYYNAVSEEHMSAVFANLLCERRIVFTSSKLGKLSACILAASGLLFPMHWQHIFIPVLPDHLLAMLHAPMPFLIGVPSVTFAKLQRERMDLSEVVLLHLDSQEYVSPFDDFSDLPNEVVHVLKKNLRSSNHLLGDGVARSFLRALVVLLGGYREALRFGTGTGTGTGNEDRITFSEEGFIQSRPASMRHFLEKMLHFQIFRQFVEERLAKLNQRVEPCDEFEEECSLYSSKDYGRFKSQYNEWVRNVKKEGGNFIKNISKKGREAIGEMQSRVIVLKDSSPINMGIFPGRATPPAIMRRLQNTINDQIKPSPNNRKGARSKSTILLEEMDALKNPDEEYGTKSGEESESSCSLLGVGPIDLLDELQGVIARPDSFIEKMEEQHGKLWTRSVPVVSNGQHEQRATLVDVPSFEPVNSRSENAKETSLIDFGPEQPNVDELSIDDFDPLVSKSASAPVSPKKQISSKLASNTSNDLRAAAAAAMPGLARHWETFD